MSERERRYPPRSVLAAFIGYALLAGPVSGLSSMWLRWQTKFETVAALMLAGCVLLTAGAVRGGRIPGWRVWIYLALLGLPDLLVAFTKLMPSLHATRWGVAFLIALAAPLWLGLLSALGAVSAETPHSTVAAGIAGVAAALLVIPTDAYAVSISEVPMLLVHFAAGIGAVYAWWFVRSRIAAEAVLPCAGAYLVLLGLMALVVPATNSAPVDWREDLWPILLQAAMVAGTYALWVFLLLRMRLSAFALLPLAAWTASIVCGLPMILFAAWKTDIAALIALGSVFAGLRASTAEEQPTALGLSGR